MMFFSRVRINTGNIAQTQLLKVLQGDVYAMHQLMWRLFTEPYGSERTFLFRQEFEKEQIPYGGNQRGMPIFYLLSSKRPVAVDGLLVVETKNYAPQIEAGIRLGFNTRVNPVVARMVESKKRSPKHDVLMDAKRKAIASGLDVREPNDLVEIKNQMNLAVLDWFGRKSEQAGFKVDIMAETCTVEVNSYRQNRLSKKGRKDILFSSVDLSGKLIVTEPDLFLKTLQTGIGHSRSFGCGLMLLRRLA